MSHSAYPNVWKLRDLYHHVQDGPQTHLGDGLWGPARPICYPSLRERIHAAWIVFTGKADAVVWDEPRSLD